MQLQKIGNQFEGQLEINIEHSIRNIHLEFVPGTFVLRVRNLDLRDLGLHLFVLPILFWEQFSFFFNSEPISTL